MKQIIIVILVLIALVLGIAYYFSVDTQMTIWCIGISLFVFGKIIIGMYCMQGHGIFKRRGFYGLSVPLVVLAGIGAVLIGTITFTSFVLPQDDVFLPETINNFKALSVTLIAGFIMPFVFWVTYLYRATYYGSEYDARLEYKRKGLSEAEITEKIDDLRSIGALEEVDGWWPSFIK